MFFCCFDNTCIDDFARKDGFHCSQNDALRKELAFLEDSMAATTAVRLQQEKEHLLQQIAKEEAAEVVSRKVGVVVLAILALLDCGWSGDWSRIGAVTQENEAQARWLCVNVVFPAHCVTALVTYSVEDSEEDKVKNGFKSFLVGGLTMIKALAEREKRKASER